MIPLADQPRREICAGFVTHDLPANGLKFFQCRDAVDEKRHLPGPRAAAHRHTFRANFLAIFAANSNDGIRIKQKFRNINVLAYLAACRRIDAVNARVNHGLRTCASFEK